MQIARGRILWRPIAAVAAGATPFTTVQGLSYPLLAIILFRRGATETFIGINTAMMPAMWGAGGLVGAPIIGAAMKNWGPIGLSVVLTGRSRTRIREPIAGARRRSNVTRAVGYSVAGRNCVSSHRRSRR
jgi:hypothetical protein